MKQNLIGKNVIVGPPKEDDLHSHSFQGTVLALKPGDIVSVEDMDGNVFDVDLDNITETK